ncbi:MAG: NUDIX domain-containing protein [Planctomycetota bacterium]
MAAPACGQDDWRRCTCWPLDAHAERLRVVVGEPAVEFEPAVETEIERVWASRRASNPRIFDGPILAYRDLVGEEIRVSRDGFKRLAVHPEVETGVIQLGVTGVLLAPDASGRAHVLFGKRSPQTRVYGDLWELAPSGGVDPPPTTQRELDEADLWRALRVEILEELGLPGEPDPARPRLLCLDPIGPSFEVVIAVQLDRTVEELVSMISPGGQGEGSSRWEYTDLRWVACEELAEFDGLMGAALIPPTRAMLRGLGLV